MAAIRFEQTTCCIAGGGPAGVMLGFLLARQGVPVVVLEKHKDFFRDFRGDTVHPSTLDLLHELGLLDDFLKIPHQQVTRLNAVFGDFRFAAADFRHVPTHCKFVALMPQWDFLDFLSSRAKAFPAFQLRMQHDVVDLVRENGRIAGVQAQTPDGPVELRADLVVGCDGRHSTTRRAAGLELEDLGAPIDVLWFRLSRKPEESEQLLGDINYGKALVLINRGDYFQSGFIIRKGSFEDMRRRGLVAFRDSIAQVAPNFAGRVDELQDWDQIKLLSVQINRLTRWHRQGLLCIGDAAHAMSPAGGIGINLAIQDAVAAANILAGALRDRRLSEELLARVQTRRMFPTRVTQQLQVNAHKAFAYVFKHPGPLQAPWQLKAAVRIPGIQRAVGRLVGVGVRPEHIKGTKNLTERGLSLKSVAVRAGVLAAACWAAVLIANSIRANGHAGRS